MESLFNPPRGHYVSARFETKLLPVKEQASISQPLFLIAAASTSLIGSSNLLVRMGRVGSVKAEVMRDNGSTGCVANKCLVSPHQYTGSHICIRMINDTTISCPIALVEVESTFFTGRVYAAVMENSLFSLIVGNVKSIKDPRWSDALKQTMAQPPVAVHAPNEAPCRFSCVSISFNELTSNADVVAAQSTDPSLVHLRKYANTGMSRTHK